MSGSSEPLNDSKWMEKTLHREVSLGVLSGNQGFSIDTTHDKEAQKKGLFSSDSEIIIFLNKPKKSMSSPCPRRYKTTDCTWFYT
jgi:hypothetical protein